MRVLHFFVACAVFGYAGGGLLGWGLSEEGLRSAMCSYYSEWDFCKDKVKDRKQSDVEMEKAIRGLSREVHKIGLKVSEIEKLSRVEEGASSLGKMCVSVHRLRIRLYPLDGKVIGHYKKGAEVQVKDRIGDWVRTQDGWVSAYYLTGCASGDKIAKK